MVAITVTALTGTGLDVNGDNASRQPRVGIRGAAGGVYVGPIIAQSAIEPPASVTHATGAAAGGVEDSTGARESDTYDADASTGGMVGSAGGTVTTVTRPGGAGTAYVGDGVQGGSTPGRPISSGTDHVYSGGGYATGSFDKRSTVSEGAVGSLRKTTVDGETVTKTLARPTNQTTADPAAAGTVAVVGADDKVQVDLHADDITGGASGLKGIEVALFARGGDTDTDGDLIGHASADGGTDITDLFTGLSNATTYAFYTRFRKADANGKIQVGPWSTRGTVLTT